MTADPPSILNIAGYRFVPLDEPAAWLDALRACALAAELKGTIIVATEGINLFVAGRAGQTEDFLSWLGTDPRFVDRHGRPAFATLRVKRSWSDRRPFGRLRVRHRPEIVTMRRPSIRPGSEPDARRAPAVGPERLAGWLARGSDDDGRPVVLLDARNAFEVAHGTFVGARHLDIARFEDFPDAVDALRDELADQTVVTFCTGGIRCEKAALYMADHGYDRVHQLDGGILDYFERVGDAHWRGRCFVFDERVALDADLHSVVPADA